MLLGHKAPKFTCINLVICLYLDAPSVVNLTVTNNKPLEGTLVDLTCHTSDNRITYYYFYRETTQLMSGAGKSLTLRAGGRDYKDGRYSCVAVDTSSMPTVRWRSESRNITVQSKCKKRVLINLFFIFLFIFSFICIQ